MPKDRVSGAHQNYGFVEYLGEEDAEYALKIMNMINLFGKPIRVNKVPVSAAARCLKSTVGRKREQTLPFAGRLQAASHSKHIDVGANLYVGNLVRAATAAPARHRTASPQALPCSCLRQAPEVDEKLLYDTFSAFGVIMQHPKIMRDPETGASKGFGFVNFASFEAADAAINAMNGQYLCNRPINVTYAYKKVRERATPACVLWLGVAPLHWHVLGALR
jgi:splicing factor 3B subunit 4